MTRLKASAGVGKAVPIPEFCGGNTSMLQRLVHVTDSRAAGVNRPQAGWNRGFITSSPLILYRGWAFSVLPEK